MSGVKRVLQALRLDKIAAVDLPCQEPAEAVILKRRDDAEAAIKAKFTADQRREMAANGEAMKDGSYPINDGADLENAIHAIGRGNDSHAAIRAHITRRAKALGLSDKLPEAWSNGSKIAKALNEAIEKSGIKPAAILSVSDDDEGASDFNEALSEQQLTTEFWNTYYTGTSALQESLTSILKDDTVSDKSPLITEALQQFADYIEQILPGQIGKTLAAQVAKLAGSAGALSKGDVMSDELKKALGLPATASEADVLKAAEEIAKSAASNAALAKMSDKHKAFMDHPDAKLPKGGKDAFASMSPGERDDHIKANPIEPDEDDAIDKALRSGDAFRTPEGVVVRKAKVGADIYDVLKSQNDRLVKQADELAKARERELEADFAKRATDAGLQSGFGSTLRKAYGGDVAAQNEVEKRIKALTAQVDAGDLFKTMGRGASPGDGTASGEFAAKVSEVKAANPKLSEAQAYAKAYTDRANADIVKRMKTETARA